MRNGRTRSVQEPPFNYYRRNSGTLVKYLFQFPGDDVAVAAVTTTARPRCPELGWPRSTRYNAPPPGYELGIRRLEPPGTDEHHRQRLYELLSEVPAIRKTNKQPIDKTETRRWNSAVSFTRINRPSVHPTLLSSPPPPPLIRASVTLLRCVAYPGNIRNSTKLVSKLKLLEEIAKWKFLCIRIYIYKRRRSGRQFFLSPLEKQTNERFERKVEISIHKHDPTVRLLYFVGTVKSIRDNLQI